MTDAAGERALPRVSVVMPVYNGARFVAEALASVLGQTAPPAEVVVVDDGSTDDTATVVAGFGAAVRLVAQPHAGIAAARNCGVAAAAGDLLAFLDADDGWPRDKLARQLAALAADPRLDLVFGQVAQVPAADWARTLAGDCPPARVLAGYSSGTLLARRTAFERVGPFDARLQTGEFIDWYARARDLGLRSTLRPEIMLWRRLHDANHGVRARASYVDYTRVVKAALDRRRRRSPDADVAPPAAP